MSSAPVAEPETPKRSRKVRNRVVGAIAAVAVVVAGIAAYHWRTNPTRSAGTA